MGARGHRSAGYKTCIWARCGMANTGVSVDVAHRLQRTCTDTRRHRIRKVHATTQAVDAVHICWDCAVTRFRKVPGAQTPETVAAARAFCGHASCATAAVALPETMALDPNAKPWVCIRLRL